MASTLLKRSQLYYFMVVLCLSLVIGSQALLSDSFNVFSSGQGVTFWTDGKAVTLSLSNGHSTAGIGSKSSWLYGSFGARIKLPGGNASGTVATLYLSSPQPNQCEFDFEFLGHQSGRPRRIHTNVFIDGKGGREQQIFMPGNVDPTAGYHYYSFEWHQDQVVFSIDWKPIRQFQNLVGISNFTYCDHKAMRLYLSIWDGSAWATEGGSIPIDWAAAPFNCDYTDFKMDGCVMDGQSVQTCQADRRHADGPGLTPEQIQYMENIRKNESLVVYNYCNDRKRYPDLDVRYPECSHNAM